MFKTIVGALGSEEDAAFLRPETAQGIFVNFKNVSTARACECRSASPRWARAFATRSRRGTSRSARASSSRWRSSSSAIPSQSPQWYQYWRDRRMKWYTDLGLAGERLRLREHDQDELSHYSCGTADIEYAFPFLPPGEFGELEGIAHRGDFDLRSHMEGKLVRNATASCVVELGADGKPKHKGSGKDLTLLRRRLTNERFMPHVIEPSAGADRGDAGVPVRGLSRGPGARREGRDADARRDEVPSADRADQGGRLPAGEEGRHARDRPGDLPRR